MSTLLIKSIPLSFSTGNAWREAGATFLRRAWAERDLEPILQRFDHIINLGNSQFANDYSHYDMYNRKTLINTLKSPGKTRERLDQFLPPQEDLGRGIWIKQPGWGGEGKTHITNQFWSPGPHEDIQAHIEGNEYRIVTVNDRVVQCHLVQDRNYTWIRMRDVHPRIKNICRNAVRALNLHKSVIGWDVIWDGTRPYILEGNTSPGVNEHTARRIVECLP